MLSVISALCALSVLLYRWLYLGGINIEGGEYLQDYLTPLPLPIVRCLGANLATPCGASSFRRPLTTGAGVEVTWSHLVVPCMVLVDGVLIAVYTSVV